MIELSRLRGNERYATCSDDVMAHWPYGSIQDRMYPSALCNSATINRNTKYQSGNFVRPNNDAPLVKVIAVKATIPARVIQITGADGLLCTKGILRVRRKCRISTCVHMDSKNHPVWKKDTY